MLSFSASTMNALHAEAVNGFVNRCVAFLREENLAAGAQPVELAMWVRERACVVEAQGFVSEQAICLILACNRKQASTGVMYGQPKTCRRHRIILYQFCQ